LSRRMPTQWHVAPGYYAPAELRVRRDFGSFPTATVAVVVGGSADFGAPAGKCRKSSAKSLAVVYRSVALHLTGFARILAATFLPKCYSCRRLSGGQLVPHPLTYNAITLVGGETFNFWDNNRTELESAFREP
ncbi:MAG: hypothetical protein ACC628_11850, partial [Pirellulaceae bacterium]